MSRPANFDAIEFTHTNERHLRVYYQFDGEQTVRESCYYEGYGWFVRGEGVVTRQAKSGTRITATRWLDDQNNMKICVFYLNDANQICWSQTDQDLTNPWKSAIITEDLPKIEIEPSSGLAVSLPDNQNQPLRFFFQEKAGGNTGSLRELRYNYANETWQLMKGRVVLDALKGTRLSAASDNVAKALRLYYQGSDMSLCEVACDRNYRWGARTTTLQKDLIPQAPISVVSWNSGQPVPEIRVYTVTSATRRRILELSYRFPSWTASTVPAPGYRDPSGLAACRNTGWDVNSQSPIHFFHKPGRREIAMTLLPADDSAGSKMLVSKILPLASIPTTIDGPMDTGREGEDQKKEQVIEKLRKDLSDCKLEADQLRSANEDLITKLEATQNNKDGKPDKALTSRGTDLLREFFTNMNGLPDSLTPEDVFYAMRSLYSEGFDINGNDTTGSGRSALIDAINRHGKHIVTVLLSRDIDFRATDCTGDTPLNAACRSEEEGIVRALLEKGSNPNVKDKAGKTPLHEAASRSNKTIVSLLLDKGASVDCGDIDGNTPLHSASSKDIILLLLQKKADVNARNLKGETPLWHIWSIPEMELLVESRANVNALDNNGWGRIHLAVLREEESIIRYLVGAGRADINLQLPNKPTPLHLAVNFNIESMARLLLAAGADRNRLWSGATPLECAKRNGFQSLIELLR